MEYTTDTSEAVQQFIESKQIDAKQNAANNNIEAKKFDFAQEVRIADSKPIDPDLVTWASEARVRSAEAVAVADSLLAKLDEAPDDNRYVEARVAWLRGYIKDIEAEHAQHGVVIAIATDNGDADQVERSEISQIVIEGAHKAANEELKSLT